MGVPSRAQAAGASAVTGRPQLQILLARSKLPWTRERAIWPPSRAEPGTSAPPAGSSAPSARFARCYRRSA